MRRTIALALAGALLGLVGCWTVDLGDNFAPPDQQLSEDFFACQIQPRVITPGSCATGAAGEAGSCHDSKSPLRLSVAAQMATPPECDADNVPITTVPTSYLDNYDALIYTVQTDPGASPIFRKITGRDDHKLVYPEGSPEANLIVDWITMGGM